MKGSSGRFYFFCPPSPRVIKYRRIWELESHASNGGYIVLKSACVIFTPSTSTSAFSSLSISRPTRHTPRSWRPRKRTLRRSPETQRCGLVILAGMISWKLICSRQKAEVAAQKQAEANAKTAQQEDQEWSKGAKSNAKKYDCYPSKGLASH